MLIEGAIMLIMLVPKIAAIMLKIMPA